MAAAPTTSWTPSCPASSTAIDATPLSIFLFRIDGVRGDGINPRRLGLRGTVSEYAVRLGMRRIEEKAGLD